MRALSRALSRAPRVSRSLALTFNGGQTDRHTAARVGPTNGSRAAPHTHTDAHKLPQNVCACAGKDRCVPTTTRPTTTRPRATPQRRRRTLTQQPPSPGHRRRGYNEEPYECGMLAIELALCCSIGTLFDTHECSWVKILLWQRFCRRRI